MSDVPLTIRLVMAPILSSLIWRVGFEPVSNPERDMKHSFFGLGALFTMHTRYLLVALATEPKVYNG